MSSHPPGMIGLPCSALARFSDFLPSIIGLQKPPGTVYLQTVGLGPANPLNHIAREFLKHPHLEWLLLVNDDNLLPPDAIPRLLNRDVDVVTGLYFSKIIPFEPIIFDRVERMEGGNWYYRRFIKEGDSGLIPIVACGDGCLMLKRRVLEAIPEHRWEYGETVPDACDHDVVFSRKVREAGFDMWCDLDVKVGHIGTFVVQPYRDGDGNWEVRLAQTEGRVLSLPLPDPKVVKENG